MQVVGMHHGMASAAATAAAHAAGKAVHVWTCNTPTMMHAALEARADAVVTDVPHQLLRRSSMLFRNMA
jgi:glycerophosphoryl diester phosphodiesterase